MTQKEMAQIMGISVSKLSRMENCNITVRIQAVHLCRVCNYFDKTSDEMLFEDWPEILAGRR